MNANARKWFIRFAFICVYLRLACFEAKADGEKRPHCGATFAQPLKFCGECGKAMGRE